jgi:two-component system cell cycle response regulator
MIGGDEGTMARIIVADDSELVRRMFQRLLGEAGHQVHAVGDGLAAVEAALTGNVDLVILDVLMPRMNGYVACRLLKSEPATRAIPVLMLSGQGDTGDRYWGLETGADHYVTKDAPPEELLDLIQRLASRPAAARAASGPAGQEVDILGRVSEELDRKLFETTILSQLGQVAGSLERVDEAFTSVMEVVARAVDYSVGALAFADDDSLEIMVMARQPLGANVLDAFEAEIAARAARERGAGRPLRAVLRRFSTAVEGGGPPAGGVLDGFESFSVARGGQLNRIMALAGPSVTQSAREHRGFLGQVAGQALIVTENARLFDRVRDLSLRDGLTGLYNHRHSMEVVEDEFERASRYGTPLSLLMIDLDHFKTFNDDNGHLAGDAALKTVGRLLSEALRAVDTLGRYGGEEFVSVLPQTGDEAARLIAERLRRIVESHDFGSGPSPRRITTSIGVACHPGSGARSAVELLQQADLALYRAKEAGRNRVE